MSPQAARRAADRRPAATLRARRPGRSGLHTALAAAAVVAVAVGAALATGFLAPPASPTAVQGPAGTVRTVLRGGVGSFAFGAGQLWVDDTATGTLRQVDPRSGATVGRVVRVGRRPGALAIAGGRVWVAEPSSGSVQAVSTATHRLVGAPVPVGPDPISVVAAYGHVWVADLQAGTVTALDPRSGSVVATSALPDGAVRLAAGDGAVWATGQTDTLTRIAARPAGVGLATRTTTVGSGPVGVAVGGGAVWTADLAAGSVARVSPGTLRMTGTVVMSGGSTETAGTGAAAGAAAVPGLRAASGGPETIAVAGGTLWTATYAGTSIEARSTVSGHKAGSPVRVPGPVTELQTFGGHVWAATTQPARLLDITPA